MTRFRFIAAQKASHPVATLCRVLGVSPSGSYAWHRRPVSVRARADTALRERIQAIHQHSRGTYGSPRVHAELRASGVRCARKRVARLMRTADMAGCRPRRFRRTTRADATAVPAPDRVQRAFAPAAIGAPDRLWVADITYVATQEGWLYLAVILDVFSRMVVGWSMATHLRTELVLDALGMAVRRRRPAPGLIHHSDRGCQYTALAFGQQLQAAGLLASMGAAGTCYDNAVAESFFATLKTELLYRHTWPSRQAARTAIFAYIETFYNRQRRHSTLGYLSPAAYETLHHQETPAA